MRNGRGGFVVCDAALPERLPLLRTDTLEQAQAAVERLHEQFREQVAANGEGGAARLFQAVAVHEQHDSTTIASTKTPAGPGRLRYASIVNAVR